MDLNQDDSASGTNAIAGTQDSANIGSSPITDQPTAVSGGTIQDGITFDDNLQTEDNFAGLQNVDLAVTDEMKLDNKIEKDPVQVNPGIENGSSRFDSPISAVAGEVSAAAVDAKSVQAPEISAPEAKVSVAAVPTDEEPKGEILTSFVNNQNYADQKDTRNQSLPVETTKNETNSSFIPEISALSPSGVVTPDPMKTNEAESEVNPSSFALPVSLEAAENEKIQIDRSEASDDSKVSAEAIPATNSVINNVPASQHYDHIIAPTQNDLLNVEPEKRKGSLKWLWITLGSIFGVLFIFAGLVGATETGMINWQLDKYYSQIGLQKMWKGLPFDSRGALLISATQMAKINQSHIVADTTINVKTGDSSALHSYLQTNGAKFAADSAANPNVATGGDIENSTDNSSTVTDEYPTQSQSTFDNFSVKLKVDSQASLAKNTTQVSIESSLLSSALSMYGIIGGADNTIAINEKTANDKYYIRIPILSLIIGSEGNKWVMFDKSDIDSMASTESINVSNIASEFDKYSKVIKSGEKTGVEEIDGVKVNKYHFVIDFAALVSLLDENQTGTYDSLTGYTAEADVWIGQKDHYMRKLTMTTSGTIEGTTVNSVTNVNVSDINKDFIVTAPTDSEIEKEGFGAIFNKIEKAVSADESAATTGTTVAN